MPAGSSGAGEGDPGCLFQPSSEQTSGLLSRWTFAWAGDLVWKAFRSTLEASDLFRLDRDLASIPVVAGFRATSAAASPLLWRLFQHFKSDVLEQGAWALLLSLTVFVPALLLRLILGYLESPGDTMARSTAWVCVAGLLLSGLVVSVAETQADWIGCKIVARLRAVLIGEIYDKVLRRRMASPSAEEPVGRRASEGKILNLMQVDATIVSGTSGNLHMVWVNFPVQIAIALCLLYNILGVSGVLGVVMMIALLPLNVLLSKKVVAVQQKLMAAGDARVQSSNQLIANIRIVKYCAWEQSFEQRVMGLRQAELEQLRARFVWWSISATIFHSLPLIVTILTFLFYTVVFGNELGTSTAFPALVAFTVVRIPLNRMADSISFLLQANVSLVRIEGFLKEEDAGRHGRISTGGLEMGFRGATLAWPTSRGGTAPGGYADDELRTDGRFRLVELDIKFRRGGLNVICGPSGSGKSSLLLALLGEMDLRDGKVLLPRHDSAGDGPTATTAYCPQQPWLLNRTIRENIILGLPFDPHRYETVLHAVALGQDLATLDKGDQTLAGEKGGRLSGGQQQRVALARALYSGAGHVLLDDCLSAVDSRTANHIFFQALRGPLMSGRTCILATHHTSLAVPNSDYVVLLEHGRVEKQGTAAEVLATGLVSIDVSEDAEQRPESASRDGPQEAGNGPAKDVSLATPQSAGINSDPESKPGYKERKFEGAVSWNVIKSYLAAMGPKWYWIVVLAGFTAQQLASLETNLWIKEWAHQYDVLGGPKTHAASGGNAKDKVNALYYLGVYTIICLAYMLVSFIRDATTFYGSLKASSRIYERLLASVLHAKLSFFDRVPLGQITNRFSKDVGVMDQQVATFASSLLLLGAIILTVIILISVVVPQFLFVVVFICLAYYCVTAVYINSSRDLKRIEAVERSPLYQLFGETLAGYISIRAYGLTSAFVKQNHDLVDQFCRPNILLSAGKEWLTLRVGGLSALISFLTGTFVLWNMDAIEAGAAGLVLTYASTFSENAMWFVQVYAIVQQNLNSVERVLEYTEVEQEPQQPVKKLDRDLPAEWPSEGGVSFQGYTTRYAPGLGPVLKGITFEARPGERIAIVGRTGAGKSTLGLSLIRGLEADSGHITIDGVDIAALALQRLRRIVTVVPQDPTLFEGSLRDNIDPLQQHGDGEVTAVLRDSGLLASHGLDHPAASLSRGQRQLLCISRALLRRSRILVLDEATASVDHAADALIQAGLRASISAGKTTVLTIAHRLRTVADYDRAVVLEGGRVVEMGTIEELLKKEEGEGTGIFRRLCVESGDLEEIERAAGL